RRVGVLVDRDDVLAVLHAPGVLWRAADTGREVELWPDDDTGRANLQLMREHALQHRRTGCADRSIHHLRELLDERDTIGVLHAATAGDDAVRLGDLRAGFRGRATRRFGRELGEDILQGYRVDVPDRRRIEETRLARDDERGVGLAAD